jgi:hypothetical protein
MNWQPIETAPMDGQRILIGWWENQDMDNWEIRAGFWDATFDTRLSTDGEELIRVGTWTDGCVASFGYEETAEYQPTHWMPLPPPPDPALEAMEKTKGESN